MLRKNTMFLLDFSSKLCIDGSDFTTSFCFTATPKQ